MTEPFITFINAQLYIFLKNIKIIHIKSNYQLKLCYNYFFFFVYSIPQMLFRKKLKAVLKPKPILTKLNKTDKTKTESPKPG